MLLKATIEIQEVRMQEASRLESGMSERVLALGVQSIRREVMLFIGKKPKGRSIMISNATNPSKESRKDSLLRCAGCTSICVWLVCDLVVMCAQAVGDRALGDLCVCVRCGSVQGQKV